MEIRVTEGARTETEERHWDRVSDERRTRGEIIRKSTELGEKRISHRVELFSQ